MTWMRNVLMTGLTLGMGGGFGVCPVLCQEPAISCTIRAAAICGSLTAAAPGSAWSDPQAESARRAIIQDLPRVLGLTSSTVAALTTISGTGIASPDSLRIGQAWWFDPGSKLGSAPAGWRTVVDGTATEWQTGLPMSTRTTPSTDAVVQFRWRADSLLRTVSQAASASPVPVEAHLLQPWANATGGLDATVTSSPGWRSDLRLRINRALPLRRIDPELARLADRDQAVRLAVALDPQLLAAGLQQWLPSMAKRGWKDATGLSIDGVFARLSGDGYAQFRIDGLMPRGAVILLARSDADLADLVRSIADVFRGHSHSDLPGAYRLDTPIGPVVVALRGNRLVAGTDEALVRAWIAGTPGTDPLPPERVLVAEADMPALAPLLPLLSLLRIDSPHVPGALDRLAGLLQDAALARLQAGAKDFGVVLNGAVLPVERTTGLGQVSLPLAEGAQLAQDMRPSDEAIDAAGSAISSISDLEQRFAWYAVPEPPVKRVALVFRSAKGWHVLDDWRRGRTTALNRLAIDSRLKSLGCPLPVGGGAIDALPISALPPMVADWLPPLSVLAQHLPRWSFTASHVDGGVDAQEQGMPLATCALAAVAWWSWRELTPRLAAASGDGFQ